MGHREPAERHEGALGREKPPAVLLVEDDEDDYLLARELFREMPERWTLEWARSYDEGAERFRSDEHVACLLDFRLGARTGLDWLREMAPLDVRAPVILLTGQADPEIDERALRAGAMDFLVKGEVNAQTLDRTIRYAIELRRRDRERIQLLDAERARAQAEAASRAKDELLALVSHELRNPLAAIVGWTQVLARRPDDLETVQRAIEVIDRNARIQRQLVDDLLDLSRISSGKLRLQMRPLDLEGIVDAAIETAAPAAAARGIALRRAPRARDAGLIGDADRLQQVVWNLLSNAIKFTERGGSATVGVEARAGELRLTVADTGRGIRAEFLPQLFEQFTQADASSGRREGGLGLGLALVRRLVEAHGGRVAAASPGPGQGAVFTVRLPRAQG